MRHNPGVDLEGLDFEMVDKEMEANEAAVVEGDAPEATGDGFRLVVEKDDPAV